MRRRLVVLSLATTLLVVVSLLVPLALLVRRQAADSAKVSAEQDASSVAALVALAVSVEQDPEAIASTIGDLPDGTIVVLSGNEIVGEPSPTQGSLVLPAAETGSTVSADVTGGWEIAIPVVRSDEVVVVDTFVSEAALSEGVVTAWLLLGLLGVVLVGAAVLVADRMGRSLTRPVEDLAMSARRLADGELAVRVEPEDPDEIKEMGEAFNHLAGRLTELLAEEREGVADLSHRLRTPLTTLRLQAEALADPDERSSMVAQVDRMEHTMTQVIELARSPGARQPGRCRLNEVVAGRAAFWALLAEEQERSVTIDVAADPEFEVPLGAEELAAVVDILVDNVFSHTPAGTGFAVVTGDGDSPFLRVSDGGPGFSSEIPAERGASGSGSSGLGLDIVRKTVGGLGGRVEVDDRPGGGAVVTVWLG
ncbi:MAG TPA: HAMP domain-containing sensor histidine kinase [Acidimicrobiia bacterium]|nr:HAMP domain-containing sensor histidine kinase [Acidimicrobiia bacterium]